jgi:hypothetical protein
MWRRVLNKLGRVLCLADPWVPAFAGMTAEKTAGPRALAAAGLEEA